MATFIQQEHLRNAKGYLPPQSWGCTTQAGNTLYIHLLKDTKMVSLPQFPYKKISKAYLVKDNTPVKAVLKNGVLSIENLSAVTEKEPNVVVAIETK